ncbi:rRNA-processing protein las1 [Tieghemiomyces parasiticus]|uniref:rRNA-processing protein las1 n=1 Tax=Tieghemiomyces parasiticus TaxID=78921 RepID=A0A9W8A9W9_9FUNG|nr:rRNA-processing protein las1 [Tieghemiomyces parasiticus]
MGLLEAQLRDQQGPTRHVSLHEARQLYAISFTQFFSGIVDAEQTGVYAQAAGGISARLGMPPYFVTVRNAIAHEELPALPLLRKVTTEALGWLQTHFWQPQGVVESATTDNLHWLRSRLAAYERDVGALSTKRSRQDRKLDRAAFAEVLVEELYEHLGSGHVHRLLIPVLCEEGIIVPPGKKTRSTYPAVGLDPALYSRWSPVLQACVARWPLFASGIVEHIIRTVSQDPSSLPPGDPTARTSYRLTLCAWLKWFVKPTGPQLPGRALASLPVDPVLDRCARHPNLYTWALLQHYTGSDPKREAIYGPTIELMSRTVSKPIEGVDEIPAPKEQVDIEDEVAAMEARMAALKARLLAKQKAKVAAERAAKTQASPPVVLNQGWQAPLHTVEWTESPIGTLADGSLPNLDLPLDWDTCDV